MKKNIIKVTSASVTADSLSLTTDLTSKTIYNGCIDTFCICTELPVSTSIVPVSLVRAGTSIPLYDKFGNELQSDQLKCKTVYSGVWGTNPNHFSLITCTPRSQATNQSVVIE